MPRGGSTAISIPPGFPTGGRSSPKAFALTRKGNIYLLDVSGERVLVLDPAGKFLREVKFPSQFGLISDLVVNSSGVILAVDSAASRVYSAAPSDTELKPMTDDLRKSGVRFPVSLGLDGSNNLFLLDKHSGSVAVVSPDGTVKEHKLSEGWLEGELWYPAGLCVNNYGRMFISDTDSNRVEVFDVLP